MKNIIISSLLMLSINLVNAQDMCDSACSMTVTFPSGGSITATDTTIITFGLDGVLDLGDAGTINTATQAESIDYSSGGELSLASGESITFGSNGVLDLGGEGNINSTNYSIVTTGSINISGTGDITIIGNLNISEDLTVSGVSLNGQNLVIKADVTVGSNIVLDANVSLTGAGTLTSDFTGTLETIELSNSSVEINPEINPLTDLTLLDGLSLIASDGSSCTVSANECITDDGIIYVLNEKGELVKEEEESGSGSINLISLFLLMAVSGFVAYRRKGGSYIN